MRYNNLSRIFDLIKSSDQLDHETEEKTAVRQPRFEMKMESNLTRYEAQGLVWYEFPLLAAFPKLQHRIWTRQGGVSPAPFASLNLSYSVGG